MVALKNSSVITCRTENVPNEFEALGKKVPRQKFGRVIWLSLAG